MLVSTWQHDVLETLNPGQERKIHGDFSVDVVDRFLEEKKKKVKKCFYHRQLGSQSGSKLIDICLQMLFVQKGGSSLGFLLVSALLN